MAVSQSYRDKLARETRKIPDRTAAAKTWLRQYSTWVHKFRGGAPSGFLAAVAQFESRGKMSSRGDSIIKEVGFFQIGESMPGKFGLPADLRYKPDWNIFFAGLEYNVAAKRSGFGGSDRWKFARLRFAIGRYGVRKILTMSRATSYASMLRYLDKIGGMSLGRQSASKVWFRAHVVQVHWEVGRRVGGSYGTPIRVPTPDGRPYTLPRDVTLPTWAISGAAIAIGLTVSAYFIFRKMK